MREGVRVAEDLFDVCARLREIDDGYFVLRRGGKFEVHNRKDRETFCLSVPFPELDARTVELVRKTRAERAEALFAELERDNERNRRQALSEGAEELTDVARQMIWEERRK